MKALAAGEYEVHASAKGFKNSETKNVTVKNGKASAEKFELKPDKTVNAGDFIVSGGEPGRDCKFYEKTRVLSVLTGTPLGIRNKDASKATGDTIYVASGVDTNITLSEVNIKSKAVKNAAFCIADDSTGDVTVTLAEGSVNTLVSLADYESGSAGLQKNGDGENVGTPFITGTGTLNATGGVGYSDPSGAAGIGSGYAKNTANIIINDGIITAKGGYTGAGIGGGGGYKKRGDGKNITISDSAEVNVSGGTGFKGSAYNSGGGGTGNDGPAGGKAVNISISNPDIVKAAGGAGSSGGNGANIGDGGSKSGNGKEL